MHRYDNLNFVLYACAVEPQFTADSHIQVSREGGGKRKREREREAGNKEGSKREERKGRGEGEI